MWRVYATQLWTMSTRGNPLRDKDRTGYRGIDCKSHHSHLHDIYEPLTLEATSAYPLPMYAWIQDYGKFEYIENMMGESIVFRSSPPHMLHLQ